MNSNFLEKLIGRMDRLDPKSVAMVVSRLAAEKGFLETVFNTLDEGVVVLAPAQRAIYLSRSARELLGLDGKFSLGDSIRHHLPEDFWKAVETTSPSRTALHHEVEAFYPRHRFLQICVNALTPPREDSLLLIIRDVTEEHRRAAMSAETERMGAMTTLAAGVAHEIGNPLNSLHIYLQLIERDLRQMERIPLREKLEKHLHVCVAEISRLDQIVNQFLKAVRPSRPVLKSHSVNEILQDSIEVLAPEISNRDILVEKELGRTLPNILADADQMKQVFFNLIRNSLHAMTRGGILHLQTEIQGDRVLVIVRDTGGGIPTEILQHIFEPYFTTRNNGTGLGLMIVQRIVREHGGLIEVSSEQGKGTTFRISLPTAEKRTRLLSSAPEPLPVPTRQTGLSHATA